MNLAINACKTRIHLPLGEPRIQFLSKTAFGAGAWLRAIPSDRALTLSNEDFTTSLSTWLQISKVDETAGHQCMCSSFSNREISDRHLLLCHHNSMFTTRHDVLQNEFITMAHQAKIKTSKGNRMDL